MFETFATLSRGLELLPTPRSAGSQASVIPAPEDLTHSSNLQKHPQEQECINLKKNPFKKR